MPPISHEQEFLMYCVEVDTIYALLTMQCKVT